MRYRHSLPFTTSFISFTETKPTSRTKGAKTRKRENLPSTCPNKRMLTYIEKITASEMGMKCEENY
jgi:hypothetical protein